MWAGSRCMCSQRRWRWGRCSISSRTGFRAFAASRLWVSATAFWMGWRAFRAVGERSGARKIRALGRAPLSFGCSAFPLHTAQWWSGGNSMREARGMLSWVLALFLAAMFLWIADLSLFPSTAAKNVVFPMLADKSEYYLLEPKIGRSS